MKVHGRSRGSSPRGRNLERRTGKEWWQTFFSGLWLKAQPSARTSEETRAEADFIESSLALKPGTKLLDVPCGDGRLSLELASRGHVVTGVDMTSHFLGIARSKAAQAGVSVVWKRADMRKLPWRQEFEAAFCFWGSFGYFDDAGNAKFLKAVATSLRSGGRFLLETMVAETLLPRFQDRAWRRFGDVLALEERSFDHAEGRLVSNYTLIGKGAIERKSMSMRIHTYREVCSMFKEAGLYDRQSYGSLAAEPFKLGSRRLYLIGAA